MAVAENKREFGVHAATPHPNSGRRGLSLSAFEGSREGYTMLARFVFETFWLNVTNGVLGIATLILVAAVARAVFQELRHRWRP